MYSPALDSGLMSDWRHMALPLLYGLMQERAGSRDLIEWAVAALEQGADSPALRQLAGCYARQPLSETRALLDRALNELGIEVPDSAALAGCYSEWLAQRTLDGEIDPLLALERISSLFYRQEVDDRLLMPLCDLQAAAELRADGLEDYAWLYPEFDRVPLEQLISEECRLYLALRSIDPPSDLLGTSWCLDCGSRAKAQSVPKSENWRKTLWRVLSANPPEHVCRCPACNSDNLLPLTTLAGRKKYLRAHIEASDD